MSQNQEAFQVFRNRIFFGSPSDMTRASKVPHTTATELIIARNRIAGIPLNIETTATERQISLVEVSFRSQYHHSRFRGRYEDVLVGLEVMGKVNSFQVYL